MASGFCLFLAQAILLVRVYHVRQLTGGLVGRILWLAAEGWTEGCLSDFNAYC
jgi:hypothetical protein